MTWKQKVARCFGDGDVEFAGHPLDVERANEAIQDAKKSGATFEDFEKEIVWHVYKNFTAPKLQQDHILKQVEKARELW